MLSESFATDAALPQPNSDAVTNARSSSVRFAVRRISVLVVVLAVAIGAGLFFLSRDNNQRNENHLVTLQAGDAKTTFTSVISELESAMSSLGSVAAATDANPSAMRRLTSSDASLEIFPSFQILRESPNGSLSVAYTHGTGNDLTRTGSGSLQSALTDMARSGGFRFLGFIGTGKARTLALAEGAPFVPDGYIVSTEVPIPQGTVAKSPIGGLQYVLYTGSTASSPVLVSSSTTLPLSGQVVDQFVDLDDLDSPSGPKPASSTILLVVGVSGSLIGTLTGFLPWILAGISLLVGILVAYAVEATSRRRDHALALVDDLAEKNTELDRAMAEQVHAEKARTKLENELRQAQRMEAVGRLAGGVAHDFNNLLAVILNYADFVAEGLPEDSQLQADIAEVTNAAKRAAELTRQLLVFFAERPGDAFGRRCRPVDNQPLEPASTDPSRGDRAPNGSQSGPPERPR